MMHFKNGLGKVQRNGKRTDLRKHKIDGPTLII